MGAAKKTTNGAADYGGFEVEKRQEEDPGGSSQNSRVSTRSMYFPVFHEILRSVGAIFDMQRWH